MRRKLFSVGIKDCRIDTFTVGGNGGGGKDTSNTGVRITHPASGAVGRAQEHRSQLDNKRAAFTRMAKTAEFKAWARLEAARINGQPTVEELVEDLMKPENIRIEVRGEDGKWQDAGCEDPNHGKGPFCSCSFKNGYR